MEKKIIIILICLTILGGSLSSVFAESASFQTFSEDEIKNADKYIINHNNQLVINNKNALIREVGTQKYSLIVNDLELCNYLISNGKISIKKNGTLYINDDDSLTIQGGNINATRLYWWGWHRYNDNRNTKNIIKEFRKQSKYSDSVITQIIFGGFAGVPGGLVLSSLPKILGGSLKSFANALERKNHGYGTIIAANWVVVGSNIKSQSKYTK